MHDDIDPDHLQAAQAHDRHLRDDPGITPTRRRAIRGYPFPIAHFWFDDPVPELAVIRRADWPAALGPLREAARIRALNQLPHDGSAYKHALDLVYSTPPREDRRPAGVVPQPPSVRAEAPSARLRQLNFRLDDEDHERVAAAAQRLGLRPTAFARLMTLRGADAVLSERGGDAA